MRSLYHYIVCVLLLAIGCTPTSLPTPTGNSCGDLAIQEESTPTCLIVSSEVMLLQTPFESQTILIVSDMTISAQGTFALQRTQDQMVIATIEGVMVVSAKNTSRIIPAGAQINVSLDDTGLVKQSPGLPIPLDSRLWGNLPLRALDRQLNLPKPIAPPPGFTPYPTATPTITLTSLSQIADETPSALPPTDCVPRENWTDVYRIQRGDTLTQIARRHDLSLTALQQGNCINNPDNIVVGQMLRVPAGSLIPTPVAQTATPSAVAFRSDNTTLEAGNCTIIRWDIDNVTSVFFQGELSTEHNVHEVCPAETMTYTLRVVYPDEKETTHEIVISILSS